MQAKIRNTLLVAVVIFAPVLAFFSFFIFMSADQIPLPPLPATNGYGDLVKGGEMIATNTYDFEKEDLQTLSRIVSENSAALELARAAMTNDCAVPIQFSTNYMTSHLNDLIGMRQLGIAFAAEGRLEELENHTNDAVHSYLDAISLGNDSSRGGVMIDEMVGVAIGSLGTSHLQKIASQLDAQTSRKAASELEVLDSQKQTWDDVIQQEQGWSQRAFTGFRYEWLRIMDRRVMAKNFQSAEKKYDAEEQKTRQLMIDLAARAYSLDKGKPPTSASDLVPDYLNAVPLDPITGAKMDLSSN